MNYVTLLQWAVLMNARIAMLCFCSLFTHHHTQIKFSAGSQNIALQLNFQNYPLSEWLTCVWVILSNIIPNIIMYESMNMLYLQILTMKKGNHCYLSFHLPETGNWENIIPCGLLGLVHKENCFTCRKPLKASKDFKNSLAFSYIRSYRSRKKRRLFLCHCEYISKISAKLFPFLWMT